MSNYPSVGRGYQALMNSLTEDEKEPTTIAVALIHAFQNQRRRTFNLETLNQLADSIKQVGILQPLLVREHPHAPGAYELIVGERRLRAATIAGLTQVPVIIRSLTDLEATEVHLAENLQREDLNPVDETEGVLEFLAVRLNCKPAEAVSLLYRMRHESAGETGHNVMTSSQGQEIAETFNRLGMRWNSFVANRLPILNLPEDILEALRSGKLEYTKANLIARLKNQGDREALLGEALENGLSLVEIRQKVSELKPTTSETPPIKTQMDETFKHLKKAKVWADPKKQGKLEKILEELQSLLDD